MLPILYSVFPKEYNRYIEVFGGSAAVLLGKPKDKFEVYNDLDGELVNLVRCIKDRLMELLLELDLLPINSREEFMELLKYQTGSSELEKYLPFQLEIADALIPKEMAAILKEAMHARADSKEVCRAAAYFMRMRTSYASAGRSFGCHPFSVRALFEQIREMSERIEEVVIEQQSFEVLIPHYDRPDAFFYLDPPYFCSEYMYDADFGWEHHVLLRDILTGIKGKFLLSQADFPEVRHLFRGFEILDFKRAHTMANRTVPGAQFRELLIANYDLLEREREKPEQITLYEMMGVPIDVERILKERILPCKNR